MFWQKKNAVNFVATISYFQETLTSNQVQDTFSKRFIVIQMLSEAFLAVMLYPLIFTFYVKH